jgi:hypothetical protein
MGFEGTWDVTVDSPMGTKCFRLEVRREEGALSGTASMDGNSLPLQDPRERDGRVTWSIRLPRPMNIELHFDLVLDGDALSGSAKAGFMTLPGVRGVRIQ